MHHTNRQNFI